MTQTKEASQFMNFLKQPFSISSPFKADHDFTTSTSKNLLEMSYSYMILQLCLTAKSQSPVNRKQLTIFAIFQDLDALVTCHLFEALPPL